MVLSTIPQLVDLPRCQADPLGFLRAVHSEQGNLVVISDKGSIFSRAEDCPGTVAVFGPDAVREVLSDIDLFGMPVSVAEKFSFPERLTQLNRGLFSMHGEEHRRHQQLLSPVLGPASVQRYAGEIADGWDSFHGELQPGTDVPLLDTMRRLVLHIMTKVILGSGLELGKSIQSYFDQRRILSGSGERETLEKRRALVQTGFSIERALRTQLGKLRLEVGSEPDSVSSVLAELTTSDPGNSWQPDDSDLIAHGNVLFMSGSEPIAVSLAWILLVLSQRTDLRLSLRQELRAAFGDGDIPPDLPDVRLPLLKRIVLEAHRVLPPNAIMVRLTRNEVKILGHSLPARCEVVLSPFVAHRDPQQYPEPDRFDPGRWIDLQPRPFSYFPFGTGGRYCLGKSLAAATLLSTLARLLHRYDVVLARDIELDWKMDVTLMPASDPAVRFEPHAGLADTIDGGRVSGPVSTLVRFD